MGADERREHRYTQVIASGRALANSHSWLLRARETLVLSSPSMVARAVEVDLSIPANVSEAYWDLPRPLVIGFVPRTQAGGVRVLDESGTAIPALTTVEADEFMYEVLAAWTLAARGLGRDVVLDDSAGLVTTLREAANDPALIFGGRATDSGRLPFIDAIRADRLTLAMVGAMHTSYPLIVELPPARDRRVLTYTYEDAIVHRRRIDVRASMGWKETRLVIVSPGVPLSARHEFAIEVPDGVAVTGLSVLAFPGPVGISAHETTVRTTPVAQASGRFATASIDSVPHGRLLIEARLRPDPSYPAAVLITALAVALVLSAGLVRLTPLSKAPEAAAAVLLAVPALFTTLVAQPVRGSFAARLVASARIVLVLSGVLAYVAAVMLVLYPDSRHHLSSVLKPFWFADCAGAWFLVALLSMPIISAISARKGS
jgi:hypothetical protein